MPRRAACFVLSIACLAAAAPAAAGTRYILLYGRDTVAIEQSVPDPTGVTGRVQLRNAALRIDYRLDWPVASWARGLPPVGLDARVRRASAPDSVLPVQHVTFAFGRDSVAVTVYPGRPHHVAMRPSMFAYINPALGTLAPAVRAAWTRAQRSHAPDTAWIVTAATPAPAPVVLTPLGADSALVSIGGADMRLAIDAQGGIAGGVIPAQGVRIVVQPSDDSMLPAAPAPADYSAPPDAPYTAEEVRVPCPGGWTLAGTLTRPRDDRRVPCVVTITGSGQQDRDEALPGISGYRPFRQVADTLGRTGIATLRLDDRGTGGSGGDARRATSADFADDVRAALAWLRARPDIDGDRLALVGHSEGGLIAPMLAASDPRLRAIVLLAGPSWTGRRVLEMQNRNAIARDSSASAAERATRLRAAMARVDSTAATLPWLGWFVAHDPLAVARTVRTPVLILQGDTDQQVDPRQADELAQAFRAAGNRDVTVKHFAAVDHLFLADASGDPRGYPRLPSKTIGPDVLGLLAGWLDRRLR